jgi:hypothetical protein
MGSHNQEASRQTHGALALATTAESPGTAPLAVVPALPRTLTAIERHILAGVAVHTWTHQGRIPYIAPTAHQATVAYTLASPGMELLAPISGLPGRPAYQLTRLGRITVQRILHFVPLLVVMQREREFTRMEALMRPGCDAREEDDPL